MDMAPRLDADALLADPETRIVVCCGSGGVGKTTTAAALGVRAAEQGRKVVVLTIDPARRLAQSMGIDALDNVPRRVEGIDGTAGGELHAMMLDMKRTFDEFVEAHAEPERARAILANPFYQSLSAGFAGTQEYMAMEKLGQLRALDEWDLIIVDTPPSRSALDFLDAPKRLGSFLDGKFIKILMAPARVGGRAGMKFLNVGVSMMTGTVSKVLGGQLMRDVQTFAAAMDTMFGGFRTRAEATYRLLQAPGTAFLVVAAPERDALREAAYFVERLAADKMPLAGLVLNRVHGSGAAQLSAERALAAAETLALGLTETPGVPAPANAAAAANSAALVEGTDPAGETDPADPLDEAYAAAPAVPADPADAADPADDGEAAASTANSPENLGKSGIVDPGSGNARGQNASAADNPSASDPDGSPTSAERLAVELLRLHAERMQVLAREQRTHHRFTALHPEVPVAEVAALPGDVHDLTGLRAIGERLADQTERQPRHAAG